MKSISFVFAFQSHAIECGISWLLAVGLAVVSSLVIALVATAVLFFLKKTNRRVKQQKIILTVLWLLPLALFIGGFFIQPWFC